MLSIKTTKYVIHGSVNAAKRMSHFKEFKKNKNGAVMLMTLKTEGVGLNLTHPNYAFHLEPWWNPSAENRATDRAHRIGQENKVSVYRYLMQNSIEEKMHSLKQIKSKAFHNLLEEEDDEMNGIKKSPLLSKSGLSKKDFEKMIEF